MKLYLFYLREVDGIDLLDEKGIKTDNIFEDSSGIRLCLYGYTTRKEIKQAFENQRNDSVFYKKTIELSKDEYNDFVNEFSEYELLYRELVTKRVNSRGIIIKITINMVCNELENDCVNMFKEENFFEIIDDTTIMSKLLLDEDLNCIMLHCLNKELYTTLCEVFMFEDILPSLVPYEEYPNESIIIDELSLFIKLFSNTIRRGR